MTGYVKLTAVAVPEDFAREHPEGVNSGCVAETHLREVSMADRLSLMMALANALEFDMEDWMKLFLLKMAGGGGLLSEQTVRIGGGCRRPRLARI